MQCEICGREAGKCGRIEMDGRVILVCDACEHFGKKVEEPEKRVVAQRQVVFERPAQFEELVFAEDFGKRIKQAREKKQLDFEGLSRLVREKMSVLRNIESGHLKPNNNLARRLEKALGIQLIEKNQ